MLNAIFDIFFSLFRIFSFRRLKIINILVLLTVFASYAFLHFGYIITIGLGSYYGDYIALLIGGGLFFRFYLSGKSRGTWDYDESNSDYFFYFTLSNLLIIFGFVISIDNFIELFICLPLIIYLLFKGFFQSTSFNYNLFINEKFVFSSAFLKEIVIILFVSMLVILMECISFSNGAVFPNFVIF